GDRDVVGAVVVDEAPGTDERPTALRQGPAYGHRAGPAEWHVPWLVDLPVRGAHVLIVAHRSTRPDPGAAAPVAVEQVGVDDPDRLHEGEHRGRAHMGEPPPLQLLGER